MFRFIAPSFLVIALAFWALRPTPPAPEVASAGVAAAFRLTPGQQYRYRLVLQGEKQVPSPTGEPFDGQIDFDVDLLLRAYPATGAHQPVGLRFGTLRRHALTLLDQPVFADTKAASQVLQGHEAVLELDARGVLVSLRFSPDDPPVFKHLAQLVAQEVSFVVEAGAPHWTSQEPNQHGMAQNRYAVTSADGTRLSRTRTAYHELVGVPANEIPETEGQAEIHLAPQGHLLFLKASEHTQAGEGFWLDGRILAELAEITPFSGRAPSHPQAEIRRPGEVQVSDAAVRKSMEQRAAGLSADDLLAELARVGAGGVLSDKNRWLWRATGLLRLHPGLSDRIADLIVDEQTGHDGRALALDLLVSVGHDAAQAAVRRAVTEGDFSSDPKAYALYNRLGFIERPQPATAALVATRFASAEGEARTAWAYTLGAVADHLEPEAARALTAPLAQALGAAVGADERRHLLRALGNAGLAEHVEQVAQHIEDPDPKVRKAAAGALRKCRDARSDEILTGLLTDPDVDVQQAAARSLARRELTFEHFTTFTAQIQAGQLQEGAWPELLDALRRNPNADPDARRALLEAMLEQPITHPRLRARIQGLRG